MFKYMGKISVYNKKTKAYGGWEDIIDTVSMIQAVGK